MRYSKQTLRFVVATAVLLSCLVISTMLTGCATTVVPDSASKSGPYLQQAPDELNSPNAKTLYSMARLLILRERLDQGEALLVRLVNEYPRFAPAYCDLAELLLQQGRLEEATMVLERGVEALPQEHIMVNDLGVCNLFASNYERALDLFERAVLLKPYEERYQSNKALALALLSRQDEAQSLYTRVLGPEAARYNMNTIDSLKPAED